MAKQVIAPTTDARLGAFHNSFLPRKKAGRALLGSAIGSLIICAITAAKAINRYLSPPSAILSSRFRRDAILINAILSLTLLLLALFLLGLRYTHTKARVDLYENGIIVFDWQKQTTVLWEDVWDVSKVSHYGRSRHVVNWTYTITCVDGKKVQFRGLEGLAVLGKIVETHAA